MYIIPIAAFLTAYYLINIVMIDRAIKKAFEIPHTKRIKPLDCVTCLSVWIAIVLCITPLIVPQVLAFCFGAGFIGNKVK